MLVGLNSAQKIRTINICSTLYYVLSTFHLLLAYYYYEIHIT